MKRRLNILCVIVMLVLGYSVVEAGYYFVLGAKLGAESVATEEEALAVQNEVMNMKAIGLTPFGMTTPTEQLFPDSVYNEKSGEYVHVAYTQMLASIKTKQSIWSLFGAALCNIVQVALYVWAIVLFIRLIVSINRSVIFDWKNVRRLRRLGLALILCYGCAFATSYITLRGVQEVFSLRGYEVEVVSVVSITALVLGLCSLIVGEVFAIGLKMKEEQDLTI